MSSINNKTLLIGAGALLVIILVGMMTFLSKKPSTSQPAATAEAMMDETTMPEESSMMDDSSMMTDEEKMAGDSMMDDVQEVTIQASEFKFSPSTVKVKSGQPVKITLKNVGKMMHDLVVDEFSVKTKLLNSGEETTVEFTPDKPGSYEFYCSVGNHRALGMVGTLVVE